MKNYEVLKLLFKKYGHENVLFIGFDIAKYEHVCMVWNGYKEVQLKPYKFKSDESGYLGLKELQEMILLNPQIGAVVEGTGGLRKMRFALSEGKSGGARVLYVDLVVHEEVYLITAFPKGSKSNLTKSEKNEVKKMINKLKKSADERRSR